MHTLLSIAIDGIAYGMILFMISVGLSVTMGLMRVINLAHGGFAMLGGAFTHYLMKSGMEFFSAAILGVIIVALIALPLERGLYRHIYKFSELQQVLATIGITFLMIASANLWLGSSLLVITLPESLTGTVDLGFRSLPLHRLIVIGAGLVTVLGLYLLIEKSRFGIYLRAAVDNRDTASALGIDTSKIYMLTFALGAALAAIGGILGAELLPIEAYYPLRHMVLFMIVVAAGGMGSITGSLLAAVGLGIVDTAARYLVPDFGTIVFYTVIMLILAIRPQGLLGKA